VPSAGKRILLVEDQAINAPQERRLLEAAGHSVTHALTGEEAIALVEARPGETDLILMDMDLGAGHRDWGGGLPDRGREGHNR
jgi:CheY-like chemotaxis protein